MDSWERFNERSLPAKKAFYSELYLENISDKEYTHAQNSYVQSDTLLLADVFENLETSVLKYMNSILLIFYHHQD